MLRNLKRESKNIGEVRWGLGEERRIGGGGGGGEVRRGKGGGRADLLYVGRISVLNE